jgi:hypothetical protein
MRKKNWRIVGGGIISILEGKLGKTMALGSIYSPLSEAVMIS